MNNSFYELNLNKPLYAFCKNATNREGDNFVGIKSEIIDNEHKLVVHFPLGYEISKNDEEVRIEIIQLLTVLQEYNDEQSLLSMNSSQIELKANRFPIQAYIKVLSDYLSNGLYKLIEDEYRIDYSGSISWSKTIKKINPMVLKNGFIFPKYIVKQHNETDKGLITEISHYCVYDSLIKIGWLYKIPLISKPYRTKDISVYVDYLNNMIQRATKDRDKELFVAMYDILTFSTRYTESEEFYFGTNSFEYIWERLIEETYGNEAKDYYFPKTNWLLTIGSNKENRAIEPDTVMRYKKDIFVLDAKYYKYGVTLNSMHLPASSSINKQISYGEYIKVNKKFKEENDNGMEVYNAFLMPYDSSDRRFGQNNKYFYIGEAVADWKTSNESHERVQGILIDVKKMMSNSIKPNYKEIEKLSRLIIEKVKKNTAN